MPYADLDIAYKTRSCTINKIIQVSTVKLYCSPQNVYITLLLLLLLLLWAVGNLIMVKNSSRVLL